MTKEQIEELENEVNTKIMEHREIVVHQMTKLEAMDLEEVKARGLPEDILDPIRVIEIQGENEIKHKGFHQIVVCAKHLFTEECSRIL